MGSSSSRANDSGAPQRPKKRIGSKALTRKLETAAKLGSLGLRGCALREWDERILRLKQVCR